MDLLELAMKSLSLSGWAVNILVLKLTFNKINYKFKMFNGLYGSKIKKNVILSL